MKRREERGEPTNTTECEHGHEGYCGFCESKHEPRCRHGNVWFCGFCLGEDGNGRVTR